MKLQAFALIFFISFAGIAQVGIGNTNPDGSAALDITATDKGFLMPRMSTAQRNAVVNPAEALQVYDTDTKHVWTYDGAAWVEGAGGAGKFVDGATPDIAYYEGKVGIGRDNFSNAHKLWVQGDKDTDGTNTAAKVEANYNGTGTSTATYGLAAEARNNASGTVDNSAGLLGAVVNSESGSLNYAYGVWAYTQNSGNVGTGVGVLGTYYNQKGTSNFVKGGYLGFENYAGAQINYGTLANFYAVNNGTVTNLYGNYFQYSGSGSVANSYAIYIEDSFNKGTDINYAFYSAPDINSYIEGNVGFGISNPERKVHISGVMRLEPQDSAPSDPKIGDMYVDTNGILHFYGRTSSSTIGWNIVSLIAE